MATQLPLLNLPAAAPSAPARRRAERSSRSASRGPATTGPARGGARDWSPAAPVPTTPTYWRLDDHTREVGLRGVEEARRALAAAVERVGVGSAA